MQVPWKALFLLIESSPSLDREFSALHPWALLSMFLRRWKMQLRHLFAGIVLTAGCLSVPAKAEIYYVAINGDDSGTCASKTTPCASVNGAVAKASPGDAVVCLGQSTGSFISITKSIDIDCSSARHLLNAGSTGNPGAAIRIDIPVSANDPARTVRIRGLSITGDSNLGQPRHRDRLRGVGPS
jgi:hypothetical protein